MAIPDAGKPDAAAQPPSTLWVVSAGGTVLDQGRSIAVDGSGNSYITGSYGGTATFGTHTITAVWQEEVYVAKLSSSGQFLWAVSAGGSSRDYGYHIAVDGSGSSYITGSFQSSATFGTFTLLASGGPDIFVAKVDPNGTFSWATSAGGSLYDRGYGIAVDSSGKCTVTGYFEGTASFGTQSLVSNGYADAFAAGLDSTGKFVWARSTGGGQPDAGRDVAVDGAGNSYYGGYVTGSGPFVSKVNSTGVLLWTSSATATSGDDGFGLALDSSGGTTITGWFSGGATFGSTSLTAVGSRDMFAARLDTGGSFLWARSAGGTAEDEAFDVALDSSGNATVSGYFSGSATFGGTTLTSTGSRDLFVARLDSSGQFLWARSAGGTSYDQGQGCALDGSGNTLVTGYFYSSASFDSTTISSAGYMDIFVWKLAP